MRITFTRGLTTLGMAAFLSFGTSSCYKDLDKDPKFASNTESIYKDINNYPGVMAKVYGSLVLTGQSPTGNSDLSGDDEGATSYSRLLWKLQELPSDEAIIAWGDGSIQDLNTVTWTSGNNFSAGMYNRIFYQLALCNEFIRQTSDSKLDNRGISGQNAELARAFRNEARFLRALSYYHAVDMFGSVPFVTEANAPGDAGYPKQATRQELFNYIESELKNIENTLPANPQYGRAGKGAVQALLAHLYLNADVYTGQARAADALSYANKVIAGGYQLAPSYTNLFRADNNVTSASEIIFPIICDGLRTQSFGGSTFLVHASTGALLTGASMGINNGWAGIRAKENLPRLFADSAGIVNGTVSDQRANFFTMGQSLVIHKVSSITDFKKGFAVKKWSNLTSASTPTSLIPGSDPSGNFVDTDIPLFRLGEIYLVYAEAVLRGGGGDRGMAVNYINQLRTRAGASTITDGDLSLDFLLAERGRECYWEAYRRSDLIRFGKFITGDYLWPYKGSENSALGQALDPKFSLYPIPASDLTANPTLRQNPGY